jgi:hypothetical protein
MMSSGLRSAHALHCGLPKRSDTSDSDTRLGRAVRRTDGREGHLGLALLLLSQHTAAATPAKLCVSTYEAVDIERLSAYPKKWAQGGQNSDMLMVS